MLSVCSGYGWSIGDIDSIAADVGDCKDPRRAVAGADESQSIVPAVVREYYRTSRLMRYLNVIDGRGGLCASTGIVVPLEAQAPGTSGV